MFGSVAISILTCLYISSNISFFKGRIFFSLSPLIILRMTTAALSSVTQKREDGILAIRSQTSGKRMKSQELRSSRYALIKSAFRSCSYSK